MDNPKIYTRGQISRLFKSIESVINNNDQDIDDLKINLLIALDSWRATNSNNRSYERNYVREKVSKLIKDGKIKVDQPTKKIIFDNSF
jgi:hypothetical protein